MTKTAPARERRHLWPTFITNVHFVVTKTTPKVLRPSPSQIQHLPNQTNLKKFHHRISRYFNPRHVGWPLDPWIFTHILACRVTLWRPFLVGSGSLFRDFWEVLGSVWEWSGDIFRQMLEGFEKNVRRGPNDVFCFNDWEYFSWVGALHNSIFNLSSVKTCQDFEYSNFTVNVCIFCFGSSLVSSFLISMPHSNRLKSMVKQIKNNFHPSHLKNKAILKGLQKTR